MSDSEEGGERGQATVEWIGLALVVALLLAALVWATGLHPPGTALARSIAERIVCAVRLSGGCRSEPELYAAYGGEVAGVVRDQAPAITYERGMRALPVDFRSCRSPACADGPELGRVGRSLAGRPVVAFTHVIDCRDPRRGEAAGFDCSGERAGNLYIQYWLYYPDSATYRGVPYLEDEGFHLDDWESFQVRVAADGAVSSRASSHNGYNGGSSAFNKLGDAAGKVPGATEARDAAEAAGLRDPGGWAPAGGRLYVSGGSHAGHASETSLRREIARLLARVASRDRRSAARRLERVLFGPAARVTPRARLTLIPIETLRSRRTEFAVTPPWEKRVYRDPEYEGTD